MNTKRFLCLLTLTQVFVASLGFAASVAQHQMQTVYTSSDFGRGSTAAASSDQNSGVFSNPASIAFKKAYAFEGGYIQGEGHSFVLSVVDATSPLFSAGLGFVQLETSATQTFRRVPLALGKRVLPQLAVAVGMSYTDYEEIHHIDTDVGFMLFPFPGLSVGVMGKNLRGTETILEGRSLVAGLNYKLSFLDIGAQVGQDFQRTETMMWGAGAGVTLPFGLSLLGGVRQSGYEGKTQYWSTGLGFQNQDYRLHGAFEQSLENTENKSLFFSFTMWRAG